MREFARLGFVLLGLYLAVSPLASISRYAAVGDFLGPLLMSLGFWAVFGLLPGSYLVARNRALATRLFPDTSADALDMEALVAALVCVLGVYLVIRGLSNVAGGLLVAAVMAKLSPEAMAEPVGGVMAALLITVAGLLLVARARGVAKLVYRPSR